MSRQADNPVEFMMLGQDVWVRWPDLDLKMKLGPKERLIDEMCRFAAAIDISECAGSKVRDFT